MPDEVKAIALLRALGDGRVMDDLHIHLDHLIAAVKTTHKKGKIVLTLSVRPTKDTEVTRVEVHGGVKAEIPHLERGAELFYVTDKNQLTRRNPRQPALPDNTVQMPPPEELAVTDGKSLAAGERA